MDKIYSPIKEKILQYVDFMNVTKEKFYKITGISSSNFKGIAAKSELGGEKIVKILTAYPDINPDWLLLNKGSMIRKDPFCREVAEPPPEYVTLKCSSCRSKDEIIESLRIAIDAQRDAIESLKRQIDSGQKRKVS